MKYLSTTIIKSLLENFKLYDYIKRNRGPVYVNELPLSFNYYLQLIIRINCMFAAARGGHT